jgi:hypothetical protein
MWSEDTRLLWELQRKMTLEDGVLSPLALDAFNAVFAKYGLPGVITLFNAGCTNPVRFESVYEYSCCSDLGKLSLRFGLGAPDRPAGRV